MDKMDKKIEEIKRRKKYYQDCFSGEAGQYVLKDLENTCYMKYTTFSTEPIEMAFREGIRAVYLHILRMLKPEKEG